MAAADPSLIVSVFVTVFKNPAKGILLSGARDFSVLLVLAPMDQFDINDSTSPNWFHMLKNFENRQTFKAHK